MMKNDEIKVVGMMFTYAKTTDIECGELSSYGFTEYDLRKNRDQILWELTKRSNGILLNFENLDEFDFRSPSPEFKEGVRTGDEIIVSGNMDGSIAKKVIVETKVLNMDVEKMNKIRNIDTEDLEAIGFEIKFPTEDQITFMKRCREIMQKIQKEHTIVAYNEKEGLTIEMESGFFVSLKILKDTILVTYRSTYNWYLQKMIEKEDWLASIKRLLGLEEDGDNVD